MTPDLVSFEAGGATNGGSVDLLGEFLAKRVVFVHVRGTAQQWIFEAAGDYVRVATLLRHLGFASDLASLLLRVTDYLTGLRLLELATHLAGLWVIPT